MVFSILTFIIISIMSSNKITLEKKYKLFFIVIVVSVLSLAIYDKVVVMAYDFGLIGIKYYSKLTSSEIRSDIDIEYSLLIIKIIPMILSLIYLKSKVVSKEDKMNNIKWIAMLSIDFFITFLSFKIRNTDRISWYLFYPALFAFVPQTVKVFKNDRFNIVLFYILMGGLYIAYFLEKMITNQYHICPYMSNLF